MPRIRQSYQAAYTANLDQQIEDMSTAEVRRALKLIVEHCDGAESKWLTLAARTPEQIDLQRTGTISDYFHTDISYMINQGTATREDIEKSISDSSNQNSASVVVKLVELGTDLIQFSDRWLDDDLDALHGQIQDALMKELKEDVWVHGDTCDRMDDLCHHFWYLRLSAMLKEDAHVAYDREQIEEDKRVNMSASDGERGRSRNRSQQGWKGQVRKD